VISLAKIYISPSTQEHNLGVAGYGTEEKEMNLIADYTVSALKRAGQTVYRNLPTMTLAQAVADSNSKKVDLHFAIHSNAGGARGCEVFETSDKGKKLASCVYKYLSALTPVTDRGVKPTEHLYELNKTNVPAALAEVSFHDNIEDSKWIQANRKPIGEAIAKGILEYLGVSYVPEIAINKVEEVLNSMNIKTLQAWLNKNGFTDNEGKARVVDGHEGPRTKAAKTKAKAVLSYILK